MQTETRTSEEQSRPMRRYGVQSGKLHVTAASECACGSKELVHEGGTTKCASCGETRVVEVSS